MLISAGMVNPAGSGQHPPATGREHHHPEGQFPKSITPVLNPALATNIARLGWVNAIDPALAAVDSQASAKVIRLLQQTVVTTPAPEDNWPPPIINESPSTEYSTNIEQVAVQYLHIDSGSNPIPRVIIIKTLIQISHIEKEKYFIHSNDLVESFALQSKLHLDGSMYSIN